MAKIPVAKTDVNNMDQVIKNLSKVRFIISDANKALRGRLDNLKSIMTMICSFDSNLALEEDDETVGIPKVKKMIIETKLFSMLK